MLFREWYEQRHGVPYPGFQYEMTHVVMERLAESVAEWCDKLAEHCTTHINPPGSPGGTLLG